MTTTTPNWINEQDAKRWLGVSQPTLWRLRNAGKVNYTYLNGNRGLMYDRNDLEKLLNENSSREIERKVGLRKAT